MNIGRIRSWWYDIEQSLWFLPAVMTVAAALLALVTIRLDQTVTIDPNHQIGWLFGGGTEGARGVLQAIAGTMITVTALVFSITVVALQQASSQLSPRVLRAFMADRGNQAVLGFFIGTFTYALLVLRTVRSPLEDYNGFVPSLSVTVAIALALTSVALLIYFVHHAANGMRVSVVIDRATSATAALIRRRYPAGVDDPGDTEPPGWLASIPAASVYAKRGGYLQLINTDALFDLAEEHNLTLRPTPAIGDFVLPGEQLVSVWPDHALDEEATRAIQDALVLGMERTLQDDVAFGFQQLSDMAARALSPGINDPTTAITCIDHLAALLVTVSWRKTPDLVRRGTDGDVRLILQAPAFQELADHVFNPIRHYGGGDPLVAAHTLDVLGRMADLVPASHREPIVHQGQSLLSAAQARITLAADRALIAAAGAWVPTSSDASQNPW